jgi:hypothetical protein
MIITCYNIDEIANTLKSIYLKSKIFKESYFAFLHITKHINLYIKLI